MVKRQRRPTPPGEILREHYLASRDISVTKFAEAVGCSRKHMSELVNGKVRLEAHLAARIAKVLGTSVQFWLNLQIAVDAYDAELEVSSWTPSVIYHVA